MISTGTARTHTRVYRGLCGYPGASTWAARRGPDLAEVKLLRPESPGTLGRVCSRFGWSSCLGDAGQSLHPVWLEQLPGGHCSTYRARDSLPQ